VGLSLAATLRVTLLPGSGDRWILEGVEEAEGGRILEVVQLIEALAARQAGERQSGGNLLLESEIPRGLGFGSSASLCVALASALAARLGETDILRVWEWAHRAEALFHGTPSGIDTGLALLGGLYSFRPRPPQLPEAERLTGAPLHLVVGAVPRADSAGALIGALRQKVLGRDQGVEAILERLGRMASRAAELLRRGARHDVAGELGALAREAHGTLRALDLSTPELEELLREGRDNGALGGKLSGAGGGGAFFLICPDAGTAADTAAALRRVSAGLRLPTTETIHPLTWMPDRAG
jgi:mevalonate kinase